MTAVIVALVGAGALLASHILHESYKRHSERQGVASAIAGEIHSILHITERRNHEETFKRLLQELRAGRDIHVGNFIAKPFDIDPIAAAHLARIGVLGGQLPEQVATFYTYLQGIRQDLYRMSQGEFGNDLSVKAELIAQDLEIWSDTKTLGSRLTKKLKALAKQDWPPYVLFRRFGCGWHKHQDAFLLHVKDSNAVANGLPTRQRFFRKMSHP